MIEVTLPDGSKREFDSPVTVGDVAASIGAGLALLWQVKLTANSWTCLTRLPKTVRFRL